MPNDLSTLNGSLVEMKDQLIYELGEKGVTASYDSTTGLLGLIGKISEIQQGGSCYHIEFSKDSYTAVGGSVTLECTLQQNYAPKVGATVTLSDGISQYSSITNQNGIATFNLTGLSATATWTCSYSNVSATCTVTVVSYLFYDSCASDNTSQYTITGRLGSSTNTATITYDTTNNAYLLANGTRADAWYCWVIPNTRGQDNIRLTAKVKITNTSAYNQFTLGCADNLAQSTYNSLEFDMCRVRGDNLFEYINNGITKIYSTSASVRNVYVYLLFERTGTTITCKVLSENETILATYTHTSGRVYTNPYYFFAVNTNRTDTKYVQLIQAERL